MAKRTAQQPAKTLQEFALRLRLGGTKRRLVEYILSKPVPCIFNSQELEAIAGGTIQWQRRWRELRNIGLRLYSEKDRSLASGQYLVESFELSPDHARDNRQIPAALRQRVLNRQPYCGLCGSVAGDVHPYLPNRRVRLEVDHKDPNGPTEESNLWTLCNVCNHDRANQIAVDKDWISGQPVLAQLRTAPRWVKEKAYEYLRSYFGQNQAEVAAQPSPPYETGKGQSTGK